LLIWKERLDVPAPLRFIGVLRDIALEADPAPLVVFLAGEKVGTLWVTDVVLVPDEETPTDGR
jgi:hypothetical protein